MDKRFLGSNIALALGILCLISGLANPGSSLISGVIIILGSLAYQSAKKRLLGSVPQSSGRKTWEIFAIVLIFGIIFLQNNLKTLIINDPLTNLIIPAWAIVAYIVILHNLSQKKR